MGNITLKIKGTQFIFGNNDDVDLTVAASMQRDKEKYIFNYMDQELFETEITVEKNAVTLSRVGEEDAQIVFEKAKPYTISFNTQFGTLGINMYTTMVEADVNDNSGKIEIEYLTDLMGEQMVSKLYMSYVADNTRQGGYINEN